MPLPESHLAAAFIPGNPAHTSGTQAAISRVVVHCTVSATRDGGARGNAAYFQSAGAGGLAAYVVDPDETIQCASERAVTWHAPPNPGSIGVELCDPQAGDPARWHDDAHVRLLARGAELVGDIARRWNVPLVYVGSADLLRGARGITGHTDVSQAWHQSTHTDPGVGFPWATFMGLVTGAPHTAPMPAPAAPAGPGPSPALPGWSLPAGHYYGDKAGPAQSHGGYFPAERGAVQAIQRRFIALGCVPGVGDWRNGWADGVWEGATTAACRTWFGAHRGGPAQPHNDRLYADDYAILARQ